MVREKNYSRSGKSPTSFLGFSPTRHPELSRSGRRVGENPGNEVGKSQGKFKTLREVREKWSFMSSNLFIIVSSPHGYLDEGC